MRVVADGLRAVAEEDGGVVGRAEAAHNPWMFHPRKYELRLEVDAAHRRRGIALALKLRAIEHARALGYRAIATHSNAINTAMLALNTALGFRPGPAMVTFELRLA